METLLLSAPKDKDAASGLHKTFETIVANQVGPEYAIFGNVVGRIVVGMKVVVFDRARKKQAEGVVTGLTPTGRKTGHGVSRYNVLIRDLKEVRYKFPPRVNRCGVEVVAA